MKRQFRQSMTCLTRVLGCGCLLIAALHSHAQSRDEPFLATEVKSSSGKIHSFTMLSNEDLLIRANQMKYTELTPSQRAMNYQWLSEHSGFEKAIHGDKAVTKLIERHFKEYVDQNMGGEWVKERLMPRPTAGQRFIKSVDYDVKVRSDELVIGVTYEF